MLASDAGPALPRLFAVRVSALAWARRIARGFSRALPGVRERPDGPWSPGAVPFRLCRQGLAGASRDGAAEQGLGAVRSGPCPSRGRGGFEVEMVRKAAWVRSGKAGYPNRAAAQSGLGVRRHEGAARTTRLG